MAAEHQAGGVVAVEHRLNSVEMNWRSAARSLVNSARRFSSVVTMRGLLASTSWLGDCSAAAGAVAEGARQHRGAADERGGEGEGEQGALHGVCGSGAGTWRGASGWAALGGRRLAAAEHVLADQLDQVDGGLRQGDLVAGLQRFDIAAGLQADVALAQQARR